MEYFIRRLLINIPVLFAITVIVFILINLAPGDPLDFYVNEEVGITREDLAYLEERFGLDDPLPVRYVKWLIQLLKGDLGFRFKNGDDVIAQSLYIYRIELVHDLFEDVPTAAHKVEVACALYLVQHFNAVREHLSSEELKLVDQIHAGFEAVEHQRHTACVAQKAFE